jgi:hypothetical protein
MPAGVTGCMSQSVLAGHVRNKRFFLGHKFGLFAAGSLRATVIIL